MFDSYRPKPRPTGPTVSRLIRTVSAALGMTQTELAKRPRREGLHVQRWILWSIARELTDASYPTLARLFGYEDHTTIMYGVKRLKEIRAKDRSAANDYAELLARCRNELNGAAA